MHEVCTLLLGPRAVPRRKPVVRMGEEEGVVLPADASGKRPTTSLNCGAFAASLEGVDAEAAAACKQDEARWRRRYARHVVANVEVSARNPEAALQVATDGLAYLHREMHFLRGGKETSVAQAMKTYTDDAFWTGLVRGSGTRADDALAVPYKGQLLQGDALRSQIERWVKAGVIEIDTGVALLSAVEDPASVDLSGTTFVLLGASSAMGPLPLLLSLGAHVCAVDIDRPAIWQRLLAAAAASPGSMSFPLRRGSGAPPTQEAADALVAQGGEELYAACGCNLLTEAPEIRTWLLGISPRDNLVCGCYAYLDGALFLRLAVAMDCVAAELVHHRAATLAFLCTPTDAHLVPATAREAAARNNRAGLWWYATPLHATPLPTAAFFVPSLNATCLLPGLRRAAMRRDKL